jgi:hypothetical protein
LLLEKSSGGGEGHADIDFGERDFETESGELVHISSDRGGGGDGTDDHVAFEADTVDGDALLDEGGDGGEGGVEFRAGVFQVVVVQVEFGIRVSGVGSAIGMVNGD